MSLDNCLFTNKTRLSAVQFTGTVQNSAEIVQWLHDRNMTAEVRVENRTTMHKGQVIRDSIKTLQIQCVTTLDQYSWIVEAPDEGYQFYSNESFEATFAPV